MKYRLIQTLILLSISLCTQAQRINLDSLYDCLDKEITKSEKYINQREQRIDEIKAKLARTSAMLDRHRLSWNLFKEYQAYMNDSAIHYLNYCIDIASKNKQSKLLVNDYIALTHQYAATGFYNEALEYLKYINGNKLKGQQLIDTMLAATTCMVKWDVIPKIQNLKIVVLDYLAFFVIHYTKRLLQTQTYIYGARYQNSLQTINTVKL
ncbi:hypothetical protein [Segatella paludivivens]|uniref:hypothetical protein n=1 Tax=Segatella paludivivens TaxID=185294 RepID=UPI000AA7059F|nr:hypothetical protein [Segatella paludivivens]